MIRVRFFIVGSVSDTHLYNLASALTACQDYYQCTVCQERLPLSCAPSDNGTYPEDTLETSVLDFAKKRFPDEYPVGICDLPLREELSTSFDENVALISIHGWSDVYREFPILSLLAYNMVDILLTRVVDTPVHVDATRGCPSDYCEGRSDRLVGLRQCQFCAECKGLLTRAMRTGRMSLAEMTALQRILDWVAHRLRSFVVMPFGGRFDAVYHDAIRPALEAAGWVCQRADEMRRAHEILDVILEGIHVSDLIVADLSDRNPNVFFEVGYAQALGRPTILLAQSMEDVPFDLRSHQVLVYETAQVGDGRLKSILADYLVGMGRG
jgi:hypothetical protein